MCTSQWWTSKVPARQRLYARLFCPNLTAAAWMMFVGLLLMILSLKYIGFPTCWISAGNGNSWHLSCQFQGHHY